MMVDLRTNSDILIMRNEFIERLKAVPFFDNVARFGLSKYEMIQTEHFPYLGVYFLSEKLTPDGSANTIQPHYMNEARIGFSYAILENNSLEAERMIDAAYWSLMNTLLRRQGWQRFGDQRGSDIGLEPTVQIESVPRIERIVKVGSADLSNELPVWELELEMTIVYRTTWPPIVEDDFDVMNFTVRPIQNPEAPVLKIRIPQNEPA